MSQKSAGTKRLAGYYHTVKHTLRTEAATENLDDQTDYLRVLRIQY